MRALRHGFGQQRAGFQIEVDVLAGFIFLHEAAAPGFEVIHPAGHRVQIAAELLNGEFGAEAVVAERFHGDFVPFGAAVMPIQQQRGHLVVTVGEDVSFDDDGLARRALYREPAAIDSRRDVLDDDADLGHAERLRCGCTLAGSDFCRVLHSGVSTSTPSGGRRKLNE